MIPENHQEEPLTDDDDVNLSGPSLSGRLAGDRDGTETVTEQPSERSWRGDERSELFRTFAGAMAGWMVLICVVLFAVELWSLELYFIVAFHGLLAIRVLFAPTGQVPAWWRVLDYLVYAGFLLFGYFIVRRAGLLAA